MFDLAAIRRLDLPLLKSKVSRDFGDLDFLQLLSAGDDAVAIWRELRAMAETTGRWPVIIGGRHAMGDLRDQIEQEHEHWNKRAESSATLQERVQQILREAANEPFDRWLAHQRDPQWQTQHFVRLAEEMDKLGADHMAKFYRDTAEKYRTTAFKPFDPATCEWPAEEFPPERNLQVMKDMMTMDAEYEGNRITKVIPPRPYKEVTILLLPTSHGWQTPAYTFFGGFNACPFPAVHVSFAKWAHENVGADLIAISSDIVEFECRRPPTARDAALRLANDLKTYAEEVTVTAKTPGILASALMNGSNISCWWD